MKAFTVRRIDESDLEDFRRVRLEALRLHPDAFGASYEDWSQKPAPFFAQAQLTAALNFYYLEAFLIAVVFYMVIAYLVTRIADRIEAALRVRT